MHKYQPTPLRFLYGLQGKLKSTNLDLILEYIRSYTTLDITATLASNITSLFTAIRDGEIDPFESLLMYVQSVTMNKVSGGDKRDLSIEGYLEFSRELIRREAKYRTIGHDKNLNFDLETVSSPGITPVIADNLIRTNNELLRVLQEVSPESLGSIKYTSGYRSPKKNAQVGGSPTSLHLSGRAIDFQIDGAAEVADKIATYGESHSQDYEVYPISRTAVHFGLRYGKKGTKRVGLGLWRNK